LQGENLVTTEVHPDAELYLHQNLNEAIKDAKSEFDKSVSILSRLFHKDSR